MVYLVVSALHHVQFWIYSFPIEHKQKRPWDDVSHVMTLDLDLYLKGYLALTLPISWIIFICCTDTTVRGRCVTNHFQVNRSKVKATQFLWVFAVGAVCILVDHWSMKDNDYLFRYTYNFPIQNYGDTYISIPHSQWATIGARASIAMTLTNVSEIIRSSRYKSKWLMILMVL